MNNSAKFIVIILMVMTISACKKEIGSTTVIGNQPQSSTSNNSLLGISATSDSTYDSTANPVLVWSASTQPDPSKVAPAIFYSPHQDDETLGMGASIAEHVRFGKPVYVVLLTDGANTSMLSYIKKFTPNPTMKDVINARNNEFIAACKALGAHRVYISNNGNGYDETVPFVTLKGNLKSTMNYMRNMFPAAAHKTISGNCDSYNPTCAKHQTHQATASAIHELYNEKAITDIRLYRVYVYYWNYGKCDRSANWFKPATPADKLKRQNALNEYKYVNASKKRYGLGYYSVRTLFDNSWNSNYEYVDFIQNDY